MYRLIVFLLTVLFTTLGIYAQTTITGKITGADGEPMPLANLFLTKPNEKDIFDSVTADKNGNYRMTIASTGIWTLRFAGVYHKDYTLSLYVEKPAGIALDVQLRSYDYLNDSIEAKVTGNFNIWYPPWAVPMIKQQDGTYSADIESKSDTIVYRLVGIASDGEVEGTEADKFIYNGNGGYNSVLFSKKRKVEITYDPQKLIRTGKGPSFTFAAYDSIEWRFARAYAELWDVRYDYSSRLSGFLKMHKNLHGFKYDFGPVLDSLKQQYATECNESVREVLLLDYYALSSVSTFGGGVSSEISRKVLNEIPPGSLVWSLEPSIISAALDHAGFSEKDRDSYVRNVLADNPIEVTKSTLLRLEIDKKMYGGNLKQALPYLDILENQYGDTKDASRERDRYFNLSPLKVGTRIPTFSVELVSDTSKYVVSDSFKGKYLLIYFWSPSGKTNIPEIVNLQNAYDIFNDEDLAIVSVALDSSLDDIKEVQQGKLEMPWINGFARKDSEDKICKDFGIYSLPQAILVDPNGNTAAFGWGLSGSNLEGTLNRLLSKQSTPRWNK